MASPSDNLSEHSGAAGGQPPEAAAAAETIPRLVIRGTSTPEEGKSPGGSPRTKVDYLTITCLERTGEIDRCLLAVFSGAPTTPKYEPGPGMRHFERSRRISVAGVPVGVVLVGGETQRDKACIDISGVGCSFVVDWNGAQEAFLALPERSWRRADIAADFFRGEVSHERVKQAHANRKFARGGRNPKLTEILSTDPTAGQTIYVGKRGGDALGRFYEKGKQEYWSASYRDMRRLVGGPDSISVTDTAMNEGQPFNLAAWYRAELELRSKNRPIPDDWIVKRDEYFAGAYPFLEELLPEADPLQIIRPRDRGIIAIERALETINRQWGNTLYTGLAYYGGDYIELCGKILGKKHSRKLIEAGALLALEEA